MLSLQDKKCIKIKTISIRYKPLNIPPKVEKPLIMNQPLTNLLSQTSLSNFQPLLQHFLNNMKEDIKLDIDQDKNINVTKKQVEDMILESKKEIEKKIDDKFKEFSITIISYIDSALKKNHT